MAKRKQRRNGPKTTNTLLAVAGAGALAVGGFFGYRYFHQRESLPEGAKLLEFGKTDGGLEYAIWDSGPDHGSFFGWSVLTDEELDYAETVGKWQRSTVAYLSAVEARDGLLTILSGAGDENLEGSAGGGYTPAQVLPEGAYTVSSGSDELGDYLIYTLDGGFGWALNIPAAYPNLPDTERVGDWRRTDSLLDTENDALLDLGEKLSQLKRLARTLRTMGRL